MALNKLRKRDSLYFDSEVKINYSRLLSTCRLSQLLSFPILRLVLEYFIFFNISNTWSIFCYSCHGHAWSYFPFDLPKFNIYRDNLEVSTFKNLAESKGCVHN
ncbi:hypothetical protein BpHYR1_015020 [Brachionus plicatilis]|uniref:Uncharacterized protein n=1 Tax=Brachionus plicatilis TaxID=10195 RepID=A0A3M7T4L3_BRAPC|nr:hypothetical protein BpHYR1_015020 [Brachionus plicatilis]